MSASSRNKALSLCTPGNVITAVILLAGLVVTLLRFTQGIGAVTNLDDNNPWGLWIAFDLLCGVVLAAGGYTITSAYYLFGLKDLRTAVRPAITTAFLGYAFVVVALMYDVGQPWRLPYPIFWSQGTTSVLFEVGLCVFIYVSVLAVEWSVIAWEWLGWKSLRRLVLSLTMPLTVLGVILSTMHQSSLGALFLIVPSKMHPLWYSAYLPVFFFFSSMFAGMSMVIFESALAHKGLHHQMDAEHMRHYDSITRALARACAFIMVGYLMIRIYGVTMDNNWHYLASGYGLLWLVEVGLGVALPAMLFAVGVRERRYGLMRVAAALTILGVVVNRFNVCLVAFNYQLAPDERYFPAVSEFIISIFVVTLIVTAYRFIAGKMPMLRDHPDYETH